jgi:signal peptidase I
LPFCERQQKRLPYNFSDDKIDMFRRRYVKHSKLLLRHAQKYLRYKQDRLSTAAREELAGAMQSMREALRSRDHTRIKNEAEALDARLHKLMPVNWESHWRENCEVILVAVVVAVGIRSYFLQPFKIPTGSMQPTLNGIIGRPSTLPPPNLLRQVAEFVILGRNYINVISHEDDEIEDIEQKRFFFFFTFSRLICQRQHFLIYCPPDQLRNDFKVAIGNQYKRGQVIARGAIDTGDQVFVDKISYNFVKPHRGDVFVFRTTHIPGIREDPESGAPFYIKRLAGLPGDTLQIAPPFLYINRKKAEAFGFRRVMEAKSSYRGYASGGNYLPQPGQSFTVPAHGYFALGDNSHNSYDSRYWGPVPEENLVGRGLLVYWPFNRHWGFIR